MDIMLVLVEKRAPEIGFGKATEPSRGTSGRVSYSRQTLQAWAGEAAGVLLGKSLTDIVRPPQDVGLRIRRALALVPDRVADFAYRSRKEMGAIALFLALTLIVTYPLIFQMTSHIPLCCDSWLNYWYMWWTKKAALGLYADQFYTDLMYYPIGARLSFEGLYNSILGAALWPIFGGVLTYNLLFLSTYILGAFGVYLLVWRLTGDGQAGIVAGVIFVFFPLRNEYLDFLNISTIQWIPFLALWFIKMVDEPTIKKALVTAVFFLLVVLSSGYYAVSTTFMLAVILLWNFRKTLNKDFARSFGVFAVASLALALPFIYPSLTESLSDDSVLKNSHFTPFFSADLFSFMVPPWLNPIYAEYVRHIYALFQTHITEWDSYLGIFTVALMLVAIFKVEARRTGMWLLLFLLFVIISLGPYLQILGKEFNDVKLPFYYLQEQPIIDSMRSPKRFLVAAMLAAAVLAGFGAHYIFSRKVTGRWLGLGLMMVLIGLIITDYWGWPRNLVTSDASYPSFFEEIARNEGDIVILYIPITNIVNSQPLYYQTIHGKRIIGGYVERPLPEATKYLEKDNKFLAGLNLWKQYHQGRYEAKTEITPEEERDAFKFFSEHPKLKYVVYMKKLFFHPNMRLLEVYRPWLDRHFGTPVYEDELVAVYEVNPNAIPPSGPVSKARE
jgi:hypothetical protein